MYVKLQVKESSIEIRKFPETRAMKSRQIMYNRSTVSNSRYSRVKFGLGVADTNRHGN